MPEISRRRWSTRRRWVIGTCVLVVGAAVAGVSAVVVSQKPRSSLRVVPPNSAAVIADNGSLHDAVTVGQSPGGIAYGARSIWVTNTSDATVSRINPHTQVVIQTTQVHAHPVGITITVDDVWVVNSGDGSVSRINARLADREVDRIPVGNVPAAIAAGPSGVWVANSGDDTIQRIDPTTGKVDEPILPPGSGARRHSGRRRPGGHRCHAYGGLGGQPARAQSPPISLKVRVG